MNKIYIDTTNYELIIKDNETYFLESSKDIINLNIIVEENINSKVIYMIKDSNVNLCLELKENSNLTINALGINSSISSLINLNKNTNLRFIESIISRVDTINKIKINHLGESSKSTYINNGINLGNNKFYFEVDGVINKDAKESFLEEDSLIINIGDGDSKIIPNLIVDNHDVVANHAAFIGNFKDEDIWYLESRGISKKEINEILIKATLFKGVEEKDNFMKFLENNKWR